MPDLLITDDLVYRCAEAALNAGRANFLPRTRLTDLAPHAQEQWLTLARAVLDEALRSGT